MREMTDTITTVENYLSQDPLVKVTEKLGCGDLYKKAVLNDLIRSPDVQIDGSILTIHESYSKESVYKDLKNMGYGTLDTLRYIAGHPKDLSDISYTIAKEIITNPKVLATTILGIAVLGAGCISQPSNSSSNDTDLPIKAPTPETEIYTTPDGMNYHARTGQNYDSYWGAYDTDGDGDIDVKDSAVGPNDAARHNNNIAIAIRATFGIPTTSKLHQDYPDIEEFRVRQWDLNGDGNHDKIDILINHKVIHTTTTDSKQNGDIDFTDALFELGWK